MSDNSRLDLRLLGAFEITYEGAAFDAALTPLLQSLLSYLFYYGEQSNTREQVAYIFWPDSTETQARNNLRKRLLQLRQALPFLEEFMVLHGPVLKCRPDAPLGVDVVDFQKCLADLGPEMDDDARGPGSLALLEKAVGLYGGDLLPGSWDEWVLPERERLREQYLSVLEALAQRFEEQRKYRTALRYVQRLMREDPLRESTYRRLMRLHALNGDRAGALRAFHRCVTALEQELGVAPSPATRELHKRLTQLEAAPARPPATLALFGRAESWLICQQAWQAATRGRSGLLLIYGEAGIGKTRLAQELSHWVNSQGFSVAEAASYAGETSLPYGPVTWWLRESLLYDSIRSLAPLWLSELARLLPELLLEKPEIPPPPPLKESWQRQRLFEALRRAFLSVPQPLLLALDDMHWADSESLQLLNYLVQRAEGARLLIAGTVRPEEVGADHPIHTLRQQLGQIQQLTEVELKRLNRSDAIALAEQTAGRRLMPEEHRVVYDETEGVPLFVVEMARAGLGADAVEQKTDGGPRPSRVEIVIRARLAQLSGPAYELAAVAAVVGRSFRFEVLNAATPEEGEILVRALDELWNKRVIREQGQGTYDFTHGKIRQAVYEGLSTARRRLLHGRVAEALKRVYAVNLEVVSDRLARHYEEAGAVKHAVTFYRRAGEKARALYANEEAEHHFRKAIALLDGIGSAQYTSSELSRLRPSLLGELGTVLQLGGRHKQARSAFRQALSPPGPELATEGARLQRLVGDTYKAQGRYGEAMQAYKQAEEALRGTALSSAEEHLEWVDLQLSRMELYYGRGEADAMAKLAETVERDVARYAHSPQRARFLGLRAKTLVRRDRYLISNEALSYYQQALAESREAGEPPLVVEQLLGAGFAHLWRSEDVQAQQHLKEGLELAEEIGYQWGRVLCLTYLTVLQRWHGRQPPTEQLARTSLEVAEGGGWTSYMAAARANLAWVAWQNGELNRARAHAETALAEWRDSVYPFQWLALWPLIDITMQQNETEEALALARSLLALSQQRLLAPIEQALTSALAAGNPEAAEPHLRNALQLARENRYL